MARYAPSSVAAGVCAGLLLIASGCWKSSYSDVVYGEVGGRVTLDGQPVNEGCLIQFVSLETGAVHGAGVVNDDGEYMASGERKSGLPVGVYSIRILPPPQDEAEKAEDRKKVMGAVLQAIANNTPNPVIPPFSQEAIVPSKYWTETTSGLKFTVEEGENTADFDLSKESR